MSGRVRSVSSHQRRLLSDGWQMCSTLPGAFEEPAALRNASVDWLSIDAPTTAAAALRSLHRWSVADATRHFDAEDWWFRVHFEPITCASGDQLVLGLNGIATVADVWLNDQLLLTSDNMFLAHQHAIDPARARNELLIRCRSLDTLLSARRPRPRWRAPMIEQTQLRWFRTTVLGRTPGWSPAAAPVGPWRDVWLERRQHIELQRLRLHAAFEEGKGVLNLSVDVLASQGAIDSCEVVLERASRTHRCRLATTDGRRFGGRLTIEQPDLWWPHTHGEPATYEAVLHVHCGEHTITADLGPIAFRSIDVDTAGGDFKIAVNGSAIFCRGACWTPLDVVALKADAHAYRAALDQVVDAGMNMLRVGGTMVYEDDAFLEQCDRRGVLLWQEFMFANMDYPADDPTFEATARKEVTQQLERLQGHACLAVLCGNSEVEQQAAMWGAPRELWQPRFFHETLPEICGEICAGTAYWPSSAHGGSFPHQPDTGTTSYYGVGAYLRPLEDAHRSRVRFASECLAFANVPEPQTIAAMPGGHALRTHHAAWKAATPRDLGAGWDFEDVRDHYLRTLFDVDPTLLRHTDHDRYLELSRVVSGEAMAAALAEWRRQESPCNGALIWFLRDLVAGAGWGIIDALGAPKAAYYFVRRALQPRTISLSDEGLNGLYIHVTNEGSAVEHATISLTAYQSSGAVVLQAARPFELQPRSHASVPALDLFDGFRDLSYAYRFGPPMAELLLASLEFAADSFCAEHFYFPGGMPGGRSALPAGDLGLTARARSVAAGEWDVSIGARRFAQSVHLRADGCIASDQYFHLAPGKQKIIRLRRYDGALTSTLRGTVHALNSPDSARISVE